MYFGAAKDLPGVRELFEQEPPAPPRKTRGELMKDIDADYYGYRDDDDGVLIPLEKKAERKGILFISFPMRFIDLFLLFLSLFSWMISLVSSDILSTSISILGNPSIFFLHNKGD